MKGAPLEMDQTLDSSTSRDFDQSVRSLARLGFGGASVFLGAFSLLFPTTPTPSTSFNSFPSYPTSSLASRLEEPQKLPWQHFHPECPTPGPSWIRRSQCFSETPLSALSPDTQFDHFWDVKLTLEASEALEPLRNGNSGHRQPECPTPGPSWIWL